MPEPVPSLSVPRRQVLLGGLLLTVAACATKPAVDAPPNSLIFFTAFSADLDSQAQKVLDEIALDAKDNLRRTVIVEGYADKIGTPAANQTLSQLRAQVVADGLVQRGVDRSRIVLRPRGPTDMDPGIESRRVSVRYGN